MAFEKILNADNRLLDIRVTGKQMSAEMQEAAVSVSLSLSNSNVTEMGFEFLDNMNHGVFLAGIFHEGATVTYGEWRMQVEDIDYGPGDAGPVLAVKAPSAYVTALKAQTGGKSWGTADVSAWITDRCREVGFWPVVQPGLGAQLIIREDPPEEGAPQNTWDVMAELTRTTGTWMFEYGGALVFARPSWLVSAQWGQRRWEIVYNSWSDYTEGLARMPRYQNHASAEVREQLSFELIGADAETARPGDTVQVSGACAGSMAGQWIISDVEFPLHIDEPVNVTAVKPIDPKIEPPRTERAEDAPGAAGASQAGARARSGSGFKVTGTGVTIPKYQAPAKPGPSTAGANKARQYINTYSGRYIDVDGAFGAQCVDLTAHYTRWLGGPNVFGNGRDWFRNAPTSFFEKYAIGGSREPGYLGDIACWTGNYGGGYGHVAIVIEDRGGSLYCLSQNPGPARGMVLSKAGMVGFLRPKVL